MGWIILDRKITEHFLWEDKPFSKGQAWVDLLLLANHKDHKILYKGDVVVCKRGEVDRSISWLAERWGWSRRKTKNFLSALKNDKMVSTSVTTNRTVITIEKYAFYQGERATKGTTKGAKREQRMNSARPHTKKEKKEKNIIIINNNNKCVADAPPTTTDVEEYIQQGGYAVDAEEFIDYYAAQGWTKANGKPIVDWKACVRSWHRRAKGKTADADAKADARAKALEELAETERRMVDEAKAKLKNWKGA